MAQVKMVCEIEDYRFEKYPNGNIVNIYFEDYEIDVFTDYSIGTDFEKFEQSCMETYKELINE